jgi:L-serine dehydratase
MQKIALIWDVMRDSIQNGIATKGSLPGPLHLKRRAPGAWDLASSISLQTKLPLHDPLLLKAHAYTLAVSE